jgi:hypothetical protein
MIREKIIRPIGNLCKRLTWNKKAAHAQMTREKITRPMGNLCKKLTRNKKSEQAKMIREKITRPMGNLCKKLTGNKKTTQAQETKKYIYVFDQVYEQRSGVNSVPLQLQSFQRLLAFPVD